MYFNVFQEEYFTNVTRKNDDDVLEYINNKTDDYILNVNESNFIENIYQRYSFEYLRIDFDNGYLSEIEEDYSNQYVFIITGDEDKDEEYYWYNLPFEGSKKLLKCKPSSCLLLYKKCKILNNELKFKILKRDHAFVNKEIENINKIKKNLNQINEDVKVYNRNLKELIKNNVKYRKNEILNKQEDLKKIKVPFKSKKNIETYSVSPVVKKNNVVIKDHIIKENNINPTIDDFLYNEILEVLNNRCISFEKSSTFNKFNEEELRDLLVADLISQFKASTTGESFNKTGKTDILMKYEKNNIFIAECKFWSGIKNFHKTIDQLLGYITWRDTKTAIIVFVNRKNISKVFTEIKNKISEHPNYINKNKNNKEWFEYTFHIDSDEAIHFKLAVIISHIPKE